MHSRTKSDGVDALFKYQRESVLINPIKFLQIIPQTPEEVKPYRQSYRKQIGLSCLHPKQRIDSSSQLLPKVFGKPQPYSENFGDFFLKDQYVGVGSIINEIKEQVYASNSNMPLGKPIDRKYQLPSDVKKTNFRYGAAVQKDEKDAKEVIFYQNDKPNNQNSQTILRKFLKPISQIDVGEQINRRYDPQYFNPNNKYGVSTLINKESMTNLLQGEQNQKQNKFVIEQFYRAL